jgi:hypothetical protein
MGQMPLTFKGRNYHNTKFAFFPVCEAKMFYVLLLVILLLFANTFHNSDFKKQGTFSEDKLILFSANFSEKNMLL